MCLAVWSCTVGFSAYVNVYLSEMKHVDQGPFGAKGEGFWVKPGPAKQDDMLQEMLSRVKLQHFN